MAEPKTIARPYARAAFASAREHDEIDLWQQTLGTLGPLPEEPSLRASLHGPLWIGRRVAKETLAALGCKNERLEHFITQLAEARRLPLLNHIHRLFEQYVAEARGHIQAEIRSARPLGEEEKTTLCTALEKRLGKSVDATYRTDDTLLSGAIVRVGDLVMDGTLKSCLSRLADTLKY